MWYSSLFSYETPPEVRKGHPPPDLRCPPAWAGRCGGPRPGPGPAVAGIAASHAHPGRHRYLPSTAISLSPRNRAPGARQQHQWDTDVVGGPGLTTTVGLCCRPMHKEVTQLLFATVGQRQQGAADVVGPRPSPGEPRPEGDAPEDQARDRAPEDDARDNQAPRLRLPGQGPMTRPRDLAEGRSDNQAPRLRPRGPGPMTRPRDCRRGQADLPASLPQPDRASPNPSQTGLRRTVPDRFRLTLLDRVLPAPRAPAAPGQSARSKPRVPGTGYFYFG
jgi:hypothetical protein